MATPLHPLSPARPWRARIAIAGLAGTLIILLLPLGAGFLGTVLPAFGILPAIGTGEVGLTPWRDLAASPGFATSLRLTLVTGLASTALAFALTVGFFASHRQLLGGRLAEALLAPLLASPHSAIAVGLAFLLAPSGWLARLVSPWPSGWTVPPDLVTIHDPWGIALTIGLVVKETPFLVLVTLAALNQVDAPSILRTGAALGYRRRSAWLKLVLPLIYPQIRLPIYIVLAFSLSVVDMALVLGPGNPPTLAVAAVRWFNAPDVTRYPMAAAAALLVLVVVMAAIGFWRVVEMGLARAGRRWIATGRRWHPAIELGEVLATGVFAALALGIAALASMVVWSFAWRWPFPHRLPVEWTVALWTQQASSLTGPLINTIGLALATTAMSLAVAIAAFEILENHSFALPAVVRAAALPLLLPQVAFQFGAQVLLVGLHLDGDLIGVCWLQMAFVLPYVLLALADPWRALDGRYARSAAALGASQVRILLAIKLPILLRPLLIAGAIGFAVSVAQYLPTLFAGGGRIATLTTEAVTRSSGGDRRVVGLLVTLQAALPMLIYGAALVIPKVLYANRRGMAGAA